MEIATALASMKAGIELATVALEARDDRKAKDAVAEISRKLTEANMGALSMSEHLRGLEGQLREATAKLTAAEKRLSEREKYQLRAVAKGVFAYSYEPIGDDPTPAHYKCQICFDRGENSILNGDADSTMLLCRVDHKHHLRLRPSPPVQSTRRIAGWQG